ncbi:MAG: hypothetical protein ACRDK5_07520 [Solirubrobacterales bacterium]
MARTEAAAPTRSSAERRRICSSVVKAKDLLKRGKGKDVEKW